MTEQETVLLNQFSASVPLIAQSRQGETSVVDILVTLFRHKKMAGAVALLTTCLAVMAILFWPPSYVSQAVILPPQQAQSSMAALAAGAMGGLAGSIGSQLSLKNPADLYIGILKSRTIADEIIARFQLQKVYKKRLLSDARKALGSRATFSNSKESLITIAVKDHDPERATAMANAFVDALYKQNSRLALTGAAEKRLFFEQQLGREKDALARAETDLKATQQSTGLLAPTGQVEMLIRSGAQLRAEIVSRQVELQAMRGYATEDNPQVQTLKTEIASLQTQLAKTETNGSPDSKFEVPGAKLPEASLEYVRKLREVKYHETLFELLAKQYEIARIDEVREAPLIQVVDRATIPDKRSGATLPVLFSGAVLAGLVFGCLSPFAYEALSKWLGRLRTAIQTEAAG